MNRYLTYVIGPETVLTALSVAIFWFCARHNSGQGRDVEILEQLVVMLPLIAVPFVFLTVFVPGAKNWWWLGRAVVFTYIMLGVCAGRIIAGFGDGAKGQDAAFILVIAFGSMFVALMISITGTMILAEAKPAFGDWFRARKILGSVLALISAVPIGLALGVIVMVGIGIFASAYSALGRYFL